MTSPTPYCYQCFICKGDVRADPDTADFNDHYEEQGHVVGHQVCGDKCNSKLVKSPAKLAIFLDDYDGSSMRYCDQEPLEHWVESPDNPVGVDDVLRMGNVEDLEEEPND